MAEATFSTISRRVVNWDCDEPEVEPIVPQGKAIPVSAESSSLRVGQTDMLVEPKQKITRNRKGNGHSIDFKRKLTDNERDFFRSSFIRKNGQFDEDDCIALKAGVSDEVAIFQVTGFISYLHREVAQGRLVLPIITSYLNWMDGRYQGLWVQYNNPRFTAVRLANGNARANHHPATAQIPISEVPIQSAYTTPKFKAFPRRGSFHRG